MEHVIKHVRHVTWEVWIAPVAMLFGVMSYDGARCRLKKAEKAQFPCRSGPDYFGWKLLPRLDQSQWIEKMSIVVSQIF